MMVMVKTSHTVAGKLLLCLGTHKEGSNCSGYLYVTVWEVALMIYKHKPSAMTNKSIGL